MKNKLIMAMIAGSGIFALAAASQAQTAPPSSTPAPIESKSGVTKRATGDVTSVDAKNGKLMVKTATDELSLDVQGATAKKNLGNIKVGDKVNVSYKDNGGMLVASTVSKASAGASGASSSSKDDMGSKKSH